MGRIARRLDRDRGGVQARGQFARRGHLIQRLDDDAAVNIYKQYVDAVGLGWSVQTPGPVEFPAYSGSVDFQYASPLK